MGTKIIKFISHLLRTAKNKMSTRFPDYMIRPDDGCIFSVNEDGYTYSVHSSKQQFPHSKHNQYPLSILNRYAFVPCSKSDDATLRRFDRVREEYHRKSQSYQSDGHGGFEFKD